VRFGGWYPPLITEIGVPATVGRNQRGVRLRLGFVVSATSRSVANIDVAAPNLVGDHGVSHRVAFLYAAVVLALPLG